ncbi:MAG: hypothetical protein NVSMB3_02100 [Acidobacteriaceae bacterium]
MESGHTPVPVRGTQSLVETLERCWRRPALTGLEVMWRWAYGIPALALLVWQGQKILAKNTGGTLDVARLGLFSAWAVVSWALSIAPLLAMLRDLGTVGSLRAAFRLGPLKSKLVEVNLVMGIVKIALIVLAMVFSATPLPFESVTTPAFLRGWWMGVAVIYFLGSDYFHVARLVAYLELWRVYEQGEEAGSHGL